MPRANKTHRHCTDLLSGVRRRALGPLLLALLAGCGGAKGHSETGTGAGAGTSGGAGAGGQIGSGGESGAGGQSGTGGGAGTGGQAGAGGAGAPTHLTVHLQALSGRYLVADKGGGAALSAYGISPKAWETFTLTDMNGGSLVSGDTVTLEAPGGQWLSADNGGGGALTFTAPWEKAWEQLRVVKVNGGGAIGDGDQIGLQTSSGGQYVSVIDGGGGDVTATAPALEGWETLTLRIVADGGGSTAVGALDHLHSIGGAKIIAGQHNREPTSDPTKWTNAIHDATGLYPALWSGDFLFSQDDIDHRSSLVAEAESQWSQGAVVQLMYHACPPDQGEPCQWEGGIKSHLDDAQWSDLITDGGGLNKAWKARLDAIAGYLAPLRDAGVEVLFRPHHEMNQGVFWWGGRPGPGGTARLYQITHDYLVGVKGLTNLIWVWDVQDLSWDFDDYNPGGAYWDVLALDVYDDGSGYSTAKYDAIRTIAGDRPMAVGECQKLPTPGELSAQPRWAFFMAWAELVFDHNSAQQINDLYHAPGVLTREKMPGWK